MDSFTQELKTKMYTFSRTELKPFAHILVQEVTEKGITNLVKDLRKRKSPGQDNILNEHIIFGGPILYKSLQYCSIKYFNMNTYQLTGSLV